MREIDTVKASFRVGDSARNPELTVFSDPAMGQANARRTSSPASRSIRSEPARVKATRCSQQPASSAPPPAACSPRTSANGSVSTRSASRTARRSAAPRLTVGQYISPRLYLGYGVSLFEPSQVVTLRYRLSRALSLEAEQGTLNSRAGIEFRKER